MIVEFISDEVIEICDFVESLEIELEVIETINCWPDYRIFKKIREKYRNYEKLLKLLMILQDFKKLMEFIISKFRTDSLSGL